MECAAPMVTGELGKSARVPTTTMDCRGETLSSVTVTVTAMAMEESRK